MSEGILMDEFVELISFWFGFVDHVNEKLNTFLLDFKRGFVWLMLFNFF